MRVEMGLIRDAFVSEDGGARRAAGAGGVGIILEWKLAAIDPNERGLGDSVTGDGQPDCFIEGIPGINDRGVPGGDWEALELALDVEESDQL